MGKNSQPIISLRLDPVLIKKLDYLSGVAGHSRNHLVSLWLLRLITSYEKEFGEIKV